MVKRNTRTKRNIKSKRFFSRLYSPVHHLLSATRNISSNILRRSGKIVDTGIGAVNSAGTSVTKHANMAVRNLTSRRSTRKNRKSTTRRNRK
jgi:hypothetical protein